MVPIPIRSPSTRVSSVMLGPRTERPRPMFLSTSSLFLDLKAKLARARALDRSMRSRKNGRASLDRKREKESR
jgi:hypothetical protein